MLRVSVRVLTFVACSILIAACATSTEVEDEPIGESAESAYSGRLATLTQINRPSGVVDSWSQPDSEGILGQNGYCGATAASNLLRWYGRDVSPRQAIDGGCWSYIGTRAPTLANYLREKQPDLGCWYGTMSWDADALTNLRTALAGGRPVVIQFMTGALNAHWVTVIGVRGAGADPTIVVMSWGGYYTTQWSDLQNAWRRAWGGYYPYVMCQGVSGHARALQGLTTR